jgi:exodeoxyribonuclease V alpha subunit
VSTTDLLRGLEAAAMEGQLRFIDLHFARWLGELGDNDPILVLSAALVSRSVGEGHVCLDLRANAGQYPFGGAGKGIVTPGLEAWCAALEEDPLVGNPTRPAPLILDGRGRLYLGRYWRLEQDLCDALRGRAGRRLPNLDLAGLRAGLERIFPPSNEVDWQRVAAALAVLQPLCVLSGGPGTGKTRTVTAILALLIEQAGGDGLRMAMAAPTGKAAARLTESVLAARSQLDLDPDVAESLPSEAVTLHRLLGIRPGRALPRHGARNPLHLDVLVVDEASMVDLPLMARLFAALKPETRVILLGDRDQLASVEAGMVLGDICGRGGAARYSPEVCAALEEAAGVRLEPARAPSISDHVAVLKKSYRFGADSGIRCLAQAVNAGDAEAALNVLSDPARVDASMESVSALALPDYLRRWLVPRMSACLAAGEAQKILQGLGRFRILCAVRGGPFGVISVNRLCESLLQEAGVIERGLAQYPGRPLMVTGNDYALALFNGDLGVLWTDAEGDGGPRACFDAGNGVRRVRVSRLPAHETVYAMTVHKAQGSEFDEVLLILPEVESRALTRELLYTGITRARRRITLIGSRERMHEATAKPVRRSSGLYEALWMADSYRA